MKKISILSIIFILVFGLNGCVVDRIKQRLYAKEMQEKALKKSDSRVVEEFKPTLYKPSPSPLVTQKQVTKKRVVKNRVVKKSSHKKIIKKVKKSKKIKKYHSKKQKIKPEPYSIEDNENDPELLGPQTTLKSNPLAKDSKEDIKENKKKI